MDYLKWKTGVAILFLTVSSFVSSEDFQKYPQDPFKKSRQGQALKSREVGTVVGQFQMSALGGFVASGNDDGYVVGQLNTDYIVKEFLGLRFTALQELQKQESAVGKDYRLSSMRVGPSIHLFPYKSMDIGAYSEGGIVVRDFFQGKTSDKGVELALGGFITFFTSSDFFLKLELQRNFSHFEVENISGSQHRTVALAGFGFTF